MYSIVFYITSLVLSSCSALVFCQLIINEYCIVLYCRAYTLFAGGLPSIERVFLTALGLLSTHNVQCYPRLKLAINVSSFKIFPHLDTSLIIGQFSVISNTDVSVRCSAPRVSYYATVNWPSTTPTGWRRSMFTTTSTTTATHRPTPMTSRRQSTSGHVPANTTSSTARLNTWLVASLALSEQNIESTLRTAGGANP